MSAILTAAPSLAATMKRILPSALSPRGPALAPAPVTQSGALVFAKSSAVGVDSSARIGDLGLDAATNKLSVNLDLKAGQKYNFSFYFASNGPKVTLVDSAGTKTAVSMASGFTAPKSGSYTLVFEAAYSLKNTAGLDNLSISAKSVLPTASGNTKIDALLTGGTTQWWHAFDAVATKNATGATAIMPGVLGLDAKSSAHALTYSFLTAQPNGQSMTGFQEMTAAQKSAVRSAFAYYAKVINVTFTEVTDGSAANINFGTNSQSASAGYANLPNASGTKDQDFLYLANNASSNNDAGMAEGGYGWMTVLHEIGHTLGLKHPGNYNAGGGSTPGPYLPSTEDNRQYSIMSYHDNGISRGVNPTTPMLYDTAALQYLYGANTAASTATNGAFTFADSQRPLQTLWSTNGTDQIDVSALTKASAIDLNAGTFSSVGITAAATSTLYSGNQNVALAFGSKIDRVKLSANVGVADNVTLNNAFTRGAYDTIGSLDAVDDKVNLKRSLFGSITTASIEFGTSATKSTSRIIVNRGSGEIFFDPDGNGRTAAVKIAQYTAVANRGDLTANNFAFVA